MFDFFLLILALVLIGLGIVGAVIPVIPGPPLGFLGLLSLHYTRWANYSSDLLWTFGAIAVIVTILDFIVPIWGTKKLGGSKAGMWGASIGLLIGLFLGPFGIILGPFIGAFVGEMTQQSDGSVALKAAFGSFVGLLMGIGLKLVASGFMAWYFFKELLFV